MKWLLIIAFYSGESTDHILFGTRADCEQVAAQYLKFTEARPTLAKCILLEGGAK